MKILRIPYRIVALQLLSITGVILMAVYSSRNDTVIPNQKQKNIRQWWLKKAVSIVGLRMQIIGEIPTADESSLWVANHTSWLDIPVIGSEGAGFLSKSEIRQWPVIGWLSEKAGTVFIQRGGENASQNASKKIAEKIFSGENVLVFPEATTGDGKDIKKFHARIFAPAMDHKLRVQPIAIRYLDQHGEHHPSGVWGDESFMSNLMLVLGETNINVELTFLPVLEAEEYSQRKQIAELAENQIRQVIKST